VRPGAPAVPAPPAATRAPACPDGAVLVPEGTFTMGSTSGETDELPLHQVKLSAFCIDRTEVTVAAYRRCTAEKLRGVKCLPAPRSVEFPPYSAEEIKLWSGFCNGPRPGRDGHPINCVDWGHADTYCQWAGGRLPTEAQWEYAARGTDGRLYPWGNERPGPALLRVCGAECVAARPGWSAKYTGGDWPETSPVGAYPAGASPFGLLDTGGNVWEWVADWYAPYVGAALIVDPRGPERGKHRVVRGGGWDEDVGNVTPRARASDRNFNTESTRFNFVGFRCAYAPA
jgi:formylglycine-generating enzyme required for sulfatase activity